MSISGLSISSLAFSVIKLGLISKERDLVVSRTATPHTLMSMPDFLAKFSLWLINTSATPLPTTPNPNSPILIEGFLSKFEPIHLEVVMVYRQKKYFGCLKDLRQA